MCDFHSICVRVDGAKTHLRTNSHSGSVDAAKWRENQPNRDPFFVEAEWNGLGQYPGADKICRSTPNEAQRKTVDAHYQALAAVMADPIKAATLCFDGGIFSGAEYADVRWNILIHPNCPHRLADRLAVTLLQANGETIKSWHPAICDFDGSFKIAAGYKLTAPALKTVSGYVIVEQGATCTAPALKTVSGDVIVEQGATCTAPALKTVSGYVRVEQGATFTAPALKK